MRGRFTADAIGRRMVRAPAAVAHPPLHDQAAAGRDRAGGGARDFLRFLFAWQHVAPKARMAGRKALDPILAQLEGFEAPAAAWEAEILPARLADYDRDWLDERCLAGHLTWMRLRSPSGAGGDRRSAPLRTTPIAILPRRHSGLWTSLSHAAEVPPALARARRRSRSCIRQNGASFFHDLLEGCGLLRSQLEEADCRTGRTRSRDVR